MTDALLQGFDDVLLVVCAIIVIPITYKRYRELKVKNFQYLLLVVFSFFISEVFYTFLYALNIPVLLIFAAIFYMIWSFLVLVLSERMRSESVDTIRFVKLIAFSMLSAVVIFISLLSLPDLMDPEYNFYRDYNLDYFFWDLLHLQGGIVALNLFYYLVKTLWEGPVKFKRPIATLVILFVASLGYIAISNVVNFALYGVQFVTIGQAVIYWIMTASYAILLFAIFLKYPQVFYVLPFKVYRLTAIHLEGGFSLFSRDWEVTNETDAPVGVDLYAGMLHGITLIMKESLKKGLPTAIQLEQGVLFIQKSDNYQVACVLFASNTSDTLQVALKRFSRDFFDTYAEHFATTVPEISVYDGAVDLMKRHFSMIPNEIASARETETASR
ncbi:MAG: hypothetical protein ACFFCS_01320 [Candidatus Hodarchaeota archaeon]